MKTQSFFFLFLHHTCGKPVFWLSEILKQEGVRKARSYYVWKTFEQISLKKRGKKLTSLLLVVQTNCHEFLMFYSFSWPHCHYLSA